MRGRGVRSKERKRNGWREMTRSRPVASCAAFLLSRLQSTPEKCWRRLDEITRRALATWRADLARGLSILRLSGPLGTRYSC